MAIMPLEIQQHENEGIIILDLKGRLTLGADDLALRQKLQSLLDSNQHRIVIDLRDVSTLDTAAIGSLNLWREKIKAAGGRLVLLNIMPSHTRLHDLLKLDTSFDTYDDELAAVNSFFPDRAVPHYDLLEFLDQEAQQRKAEQTTKPA